ncbi:hypothetical protein [Magnetospirillum moscoviense]|uniref:Uncharacterized protein n=1 Tax=Magnetospirillum moscoviense TaxID=1437059 RepID=A0A178M7L0_9PROT|nr:hypothetical protein [Magnetospirillum moscoviense]MBF0325385.1 hypothetical protein [Alphaproteobacteria bacterium]OAN44513.1 hypothetical protein A6A05_04945 [Magnetospirillum moscoviense]
MTKKVLAQPGFAISRELNATAKGSPQRADNIVLLEVGLNQDFACIIFMAIQTPRQHGRQFG